jgi:hypothetical protein
MNKREREHTRLNGSGRTAEQHEPADCPTGWRSDVEAVEAFTLGSRSARQQMLSQALRVDMRGLSAAALHPR